MADDSGTRRLTLASDADTPLNGTDGAWSFGVVSQVYVSGLSQIRSPQAQERPASNRSESDTDAPRSSTVLPSLTPVTVSNPYLGKRAFPPTYHWEGVVETVSEAGFRGRLMPVEAGQPEPARIEYADFDFDDLSDPCEEALVQPGAVFYWTIGRSTNPAGTITKQSLIRFRRLPPVSSVERERSGSEAEALLRDLDAQ